jgi:hypothetical protein
MRSERDVWKKEYYKMPGFIKHGRLKTAGLS